MIPRTTLEQWAILDAVITHGSFAQAAEELNKSQSSISYAIKSLQAQLPTDVLVIKGRKAQLTPAGEILLRRSKQLLEQANTLEKIAQNLAQNWEAEITVACDVIFPTELLYQAISQFEPISGGCSIKILETTLSATDESLYSGDTNLVISGRIPPGFFGTPLLQTTFIALSSPDHPLQNLSRAINEQDLKQHRQIIVRDGGIKRNQDTGWQNTEQRWTVTSFASSIAMLERGFGFAWVPLSHAQNAINIGTLKPLNLTVGQTRKITCQLILPDCDNTGPAARELAKIITQVCQQYSKDEASID